MLNLLRTFSIYSSSKSHNFPWPLLLVMCIPIICLAYPESFISKNLAKYISVLKSSSYSGSQLAFCSHSITMKSRVLDFYKNMLIPDDIFLYLWLVTVNSNFSYHYIGSLFKLYKLSHQTCHWPQIPLVSPCRHHPRDHQVTKLSRHQVAAPPNSL